MPLLVRGSGGRPCLDTDRRTSIDRTVVSGFRLLELQVAALRDWIGPLRRKGKQALRWRRSCCGCCGDSGRPWASGDSWIAPGEPVLDRHRSACAMLASVEKGEGDRRRWHRFRTPCGRPKRNERSAHNAGPLPVAKIWMDFAGQRAAMTRFLLGGSRSLARPPGMRCMSPCAAVRLASGRGSAPKGEPQSRIPSS